MKYQEPHSQPFFNTQHSGWLIFFPNVPSPPPLPLPPCFWKDFKHPCKTLWNFVFGGKEVAQSLWLNFSNQLSQVDVFGWSIWNGYIYKLTTNAINYWMKFNWITWMKIWGWEWHGMTRHGSQKVTNALRSGPPSFQKHLNSLWACRTSHPFGSNLHPLGKRALPGEKLDHSYGW